MTPLPRDATPSVPATRAVHLALGGLWLLDGLLQLQPHMFGDAFVTQVLQPSAQGQAGWIAWLVGTNARFVALHVAAWTALFASVQLLIGTGLVLRATVKPALALSVVWSLGVWALGEGFGMLLTGTASPLTGAPGAALLYVLVALIAWPRPPHDAAPAARVGAGPRHPAGTVAGWRGDGSVASRGLLGAAGARVAWAGLWVLDGVLWLLPANTATGAVGRQISAAAAGEPRWLAGILTWAGHQSSSAGAGTAVVVAALSFAVGLGPLLARRPTPYLVVGSLLALVFWVLGQAFGGILTGPLSGTATDPNAGPLVVLVASALLPGRARTRRTWEPAAPVAETPVFTLPF